MFKSCDDEKLISVNKPMSSFIGCNFLYEYENGKREIVRIVDKCIYVVFNEYGDMTVECAECKEPTLGDITNNCYAVANGYVKLIKNVTFDVNYSI